MTDREARLWVTVGIAAARHNIAPPPAAQASAVRRIAAIPNDDAMFTAMEAEMKRWPKVRKKERTP